MFKLTDIPKEYKANYKQLIKKSIPEINKRKVAVISMYCNRFIWTRCCLYSLDPIYAGVFYQNYHLYLINNNSIDSTSNYFNTFSEFRSFVEQVRHTENKGKPWAFNHALSLIPEDTDYVVSVDGDVEMPENWLLHMITCYEELVKEGINVGQLACDYNLLPGCRKTVNPNSLHQPERCKILENGIVLDNTPDVAGGCLLWSAKDIKEAGGYQIIKSPINDSNHLYGMDDGLINLHMKQLNMLSCYLVNVRGNHWGDYDESIYGDYQEWKHKNLNPIVQEQLKPHEIGVDFDWKKLRKYEDIQDIKKQLLKYVSSESFDIIAQLYKKGASKIYE